MFDSHAHYDDEKFVNDRDDIICSVHAKGVNYILNASIDIVSSGESIKLANKYDFIYAAVGIHPHESGRFQESDIDKIYDLAINNTKVVAVGEIGLDYHYNFASKEQQKLWFIMQIELARKIGKPVVIHNREAHNDILQIIKQYSAKDCGGVLHCYSGSKEMLKTFIDNNMYISVGGPITFKNARNLIDVVKFVPIDRLLIETDCPYLAPEPFRGKRNDSSLLKFIIERIADIKEISVEKVIQTTTKNARILFRI